jgi:preprotein translocase subunit SecA
MIGALLQKIFGTKNEREIKRMRPIVQKINQLEDSFLALSDLELTAKTGEFRERIARGETLDSILPEAFALVRETSRRKLGMRHFDVQLMGGIVLHEGKITEMKTGEGKTLVATLPLYLNALAGKGAHLVTVNDYLVRRDAEWMSPIFTHLGLEIGIIQNSQNDTERKKAYNADITYGTNNEFGFDYLRDNMKFDLDDMVQRELNFAIVDEVDSVLIDEARTPLIISGAAERGADFYQQANHAIRNLKKDEDFEVDEKARSIHLTESGNDKVESAMGVGNLYAPENILALHHVNQALRAHKLFKRDVDYIVRDGQVLIVDEFTGRILSGRRYSDGLHQALETKEGVKIERENQTLATITLQNYFRLYKKLSGMTGTAVTEAQEFHTTYKLGVVVIPTHRPMNRRDEPDTIYLDTEDKFAAITEDIRDCYKRGQPVLVGTIAIETSELLSNQLAKANIPHNVLNAKQHEREAEIVKEAGQVAKVTIATNMAGRGTDIKLSIDALEAGGLRIIGTERHESRRIDNQLRGRSGRQGDRGSSKFYLSLDDDLMRIFGGDKVKKTMERIGMQKGENIEHKLITRSIAKAQEKVEKYNFGIRKNLLEYDDVLNQQRTAVYQYRREILEGSGQTYELIKEILLDIAQDVFTLHCPGATCSVQALEDVMQTLSLLTGINLAAEFTLSDATSKEKFFDHLLYKYEQYRAQFNDELVRDAEKWTLLETIDQAWKNHLLDMDKLKEGIHLRGYGQKNPIVEYKKESFIAFSNMMKQIKWNIIERIFKLKPENFTERHIDEIKDERQRELDQIQTSHNAQEQAQPQRRAENKIGRNDPCSCGSGKKYKKCHGA